MEAGKQTNEFYDYPERTKFEKKFFLKKKKKFDQRLSLTVVIDDEMRVFIISKENHLFDSKR